MDVWAPDRTSGALLVSPDWFTSSRGSFGQTQPLSPPCSGMVALIDRAHSGESGSCTHCGSLVLSLLLAWKHGLGGTFSPQKHLSALSHWNDLGLFCCHDSSVERGIARITPHVRHRQLFQCVDAPVERAALRQSAPSTRLPHHLDLVVSPADAPLGALARLLHGSLASVGLEAVFPRGDLSAYGSEKPRSTSCTAHTATASMNVVDGG